MKIVKDNMRGRSSIERRIENENLSSNDLSGNETRDNVSMHNFKNTLIAFVRQVGRGGNTQWQ